MIKKWLEEYLQAGGNLHQGPGNVFIIYKGFKITKGEDEYRIMDTRYTDFYTKPSKKDLSTLEELGFVKGCDMMMYHRDCERIGKYRHLLESTYKARDVHYSRKGELRPKKYRTALATLNRGLREHLDNLLFFETRKNQIETKYSIET